MTERFDGSEVRAALYQQWARAYRAAYRAARDYREQLAVDIRWCTVQRALWAMEP